MTRFLLLLWCSWIAGCAVDEGGSSDGRLDQALGGGGTGACWTNAECSARLSAPAVCADEPVRRCVPLRSEDCSVVTGDHLDDRAVLVASLLSTTGVQAGTNLPRQQAAILAVEEYNAARPPWARELVMVSCDEAANLPRVATHLVSDLGVRAIVGPNLSQDVVDLTLGVPARGIPSAAAAGVALLTPTALAASIAALDDDGQTFQMVPNDLQRAPLLRLQLNALETELRAARGTPAIKLGIYFRADATGRGTRDGLDALVLNGAPLASALAAGTARADAYDPASTDQSALVAAYAQLQPDLIVIVGAAEAVRYFLLPLEAAWPAGAPRPHYLATDATKIGDLLAAVAGNHDLRRRIRGTGIATPPESAPIAAAFQQAYGARWVDANGNPQPATQFGMAQAYDAAYAIALAAHAGGPAALHRRIAGRLDELATYTGACTGHAPCFALTDEAALPANLARLYTRKRVAELGASGRLAWDAQGAKTSGAIEVWCIDGSGAAPRFASSGLTFDIQSGTVAGAFTACGP